MFRGIELTGEYIDDLLVITKGDWSDHLDKLELVLKNLRVNGIKYNIEKSYFGQTKMEYLGLWGTQTETRPISKKVEATVNTTSPKNQKQVHLFIGKF